MSFLSDYDQPGGLPRASRQTTVSRVKETMPPWAGCLVQLVNLRERVSDNGLVSKLFRGWTCVRHIPLHATSTKLDGCQYYCVAH